MYCKLHKCPDGVFIKFYETDQQEKAEKDYQESSQDIVENGDIGWALIEITDIEDEIVIDTNCFGEICTKNRIISKQGL